MSERRVGQKLAKSLGLLARVLEFGLLVGGVSGLLLGYSHSRPPPVTQPPKVQALDIAAQRVVDLEESQVEEAVRNGTHGLAKDSRVPVVGPDGRAGTVPASEARDAFQRQGFHYRTYAERHPPPAPFMEQDLAQLGLAALGAMILLVCLDQWVRWLFRKDRGTSSGPAPQHTEAGGGGRPG